MNNECSQQSEGQILLYKAADLFYESKIDESMEMLNQIQVMDLQNNSDQALYKRYLLLNFMNQGNLKQARDLRDDILNQYYLRFKHEQKDDFQEKVDIQDIMLFICILSYHERFLLSVFQKEFTEEQLYDLKNIYKSQKGNLSPIEEIIFQLSESLIFIIGYSNEDEFNYNLLIESLSGRQLEDCLDYVISSILRYNPFKKVIVNKKFERCAHKLYEINPQHPLICFSLAIYYQNASYEKAFDYFCQAFKLYNKNPVCNAFFLKFLTQYQKQEEFENYYQQISSINLNHYRVALARAEFLVSNNKQSEAIEVILTTLRQTNDKKLILDDYNNFQLSIDSFFDEDQLRFLCESAIKYGYNNFYFYQKLQNIYMESEEYDQLLNISFQYIKQQQENGEDVNASIYQQMENVYEYQNNIKSYIELQLTKYQNYDRIFEFSKFKFDYQALDQIFQDYSSQLIEFIVQWVEQSQSEDDDELIQGQMNYELNQKLLYLTYFKYQLEINNLLLTQTIFNKQFKDIGIFKQQYLLLDLYF
ncbi:hypothetical protein ABPG74_021098 [Tetrahymena malaccensis]